MTWKGYKIMLNQQAAETGFVLDPRLEEIGHPIGDFPLCHVFLLDDARFPWVMLVPRRAGISEILDLTEADQQLLFGETMRAAKALQAVSKPDKLNIGALGNIVRQLHVHIIGRFQSDPAWPGPVWGHGERVPYPPHMVGPLVDRLAKHWVCEAFRMKDQISGISADIEALFSPLMERHPPAGLGFAHGALDRSAQMRARPELVDALRHAPEARFYAFCGDNALLRRQGDGATPLFSAHELPLPEHHREVIFLGRDGEAGRFAVLIAPEAEEALKENASLLVIGLRALALDDRTDAADLGAIAQGKAMLHWHATHRFCAKCGAPSRVAEAGWKRVCTACSTEHFPRTDPVVIMLTVDGERCLLGRSARFPPGWYSTLAGFVEPGETIEDAVRRETFEEAGIIGGRVTIMANQPWPFPASLMIGAYVEAKSTKIAIDLEELEDCRWFSRDEVKQMLAGAHPDGLGVPAKMSIASHLIRHFVGE